MSKIKIAYLLLVHKNANQVNIFINQLLNYGDCDIFIHVDCKNSFLESQLKESPHHRVRRNEEISRLEEESVNKPEIINAGAMNVLNRVSNKLNGTTLFTYFCRNGFQKYTSIDCK